MKKTKLLRCMAFFLAVMLTMGMIIPKHQIQVQAATPTTITVSEELYDKIKSSMGMGNNLHAVDAGITYDDTNHQIKFNDISEVTHLNLYDLPKGTDFRELSKFTGLENLRIFRSDLSDSSLTVINSLTNLETLDLTNCNLTSVPDINLDQLKNLNLDENNLSGIGALDNLNATSLPNLISLSAENCQVEDFSFLRNITGLKSLYLYKNDLSVFPLTEINGLTDLITLNLTDCNLTSVPDINLDQLKYLFLSSNNLSESGALDNLNATSLPNLESLYVDHCRLADISFLRNLNTSGILTKLFLGDNRLTDDSMTVIKDLKNTVLQNVTELNVGRRIYFGFGECTAGVNGNSITDFEPIFELPNLTVLDLSELSITSLEPFVTHTGIRINFERNEITEFCGLEGINNFNLHNQNTVLTGDYVAGRSAEIPDFLKKVLDPLDPLHGTVTYINCSLSDDKTKIQFDSGYSTPLIEIKSGKLYGSYYCFKVKLVPSFTVPTGLTANVGDTLAQVSFSDRHFSWMNDSLDVGTAGKRTFMAKYTPSFPTNYIVVEDIPVELHIYNNITSVELTDIETPTANTTLDTEASCATIGVSNTTPQITWTPDDSTAGYNTSYTASITLTADTDYKFADIVTATVSGNTASVTKNADGTLTVKYVFPTTAKDKLTSITAPQPITVANGTAYSGMNLPERVNIVTEGNTVTSALVTWDTTTPASGSYNPAVLTEQTVTLNGTVDCPATIDANGVSLTTTITITMSAAGIVGAPTVNPIAGTYTENQSVTLTSSTEGATIYYTTDGSKPTITGGVPEGTTRKYTAPIPVTGAEGQSITTIIKAIAVKSGMQDSSVKTFTYNIKIPKSIHYDILDGANSNWTLNSDVSLSFRGSGEFSKFEGVKVDGTLVDAKNYTVKDGSTIVTLKADYLNTLSVGTHTLEILWTDGSASTTFTINADTSDKKDDSPDTGDKTPVAWLFIISIISGTGVILTTKKGRKNLKALEK